MAAAEPEVVVVEEVVEESGEEVETDSLEVFWEMLSGPRLFASGWGLVASIVLL